jgi:hypothetical protein
VTIEEYRALRQAAWDDYPTAVREHFDTEGTFKSAWERGYADAVREMRKQDAEQAARIREAVTPPLDPYPWYVNDSLRLRYRGALTGPVWDPRPGYEQDIERYPEDQYGRPRPGDTTTA